MSPCRAAWGTSHPDFWSSISGKKTAAKLGVFLKWFEKDLQGLSPSERYDRVMVMFKRLDQVIKICVVTSADFTMAYRTFANAQALGLPLDDLERLRSLLVSEARRGLTGVEALGKWSVYHKKLESLQGRLVDSRECHTWQRSHIGAGNLAFTKHTILYVG